jgi:hypothetical protein
MRGRSLLLVSVVLFASCSAQDPAVHAMTESLGAALHRGDRAAVASYFSVLPLESVLEAAAQRNALAQESDARLAELRAFYARGDESPGRAAVAVVAEQISLERMRRAATVSDEMLARSIAAERLIGCLHDAQQVEVTVRGKHVQIRGGSCERSLRLITAPGDRPVLSFPSR